MIGLWLENLRDAEMQMRHSSATSQSSLRAKRFNLACRKATVVVASLFVLGLAACGKTNDVSVLPASEQAPVAESLLSKATAKGDIKEIKELLDGGADINAIDALGRTPLHIAAFYGNLKASEILIANGASINARDHVGMTPLHAAVLSGGRQEVELLMEKQADINAKSDSGQTALHLSAATGQPKLSKYLIEKGADPQSLDTDGKTPLFYATRNQHPQTTALLKQHSSKK